MGGARKLPDKNNNLESTKYIEQQVFLDEHLPKCITYSKVKRHHSTKPTTLIYTKVGAEYSFPILP